MRLTHYLVVFGADPEFFFTEKGSVIGAEKVLPKEGVMQMRSQYKMNKDGSNVIETDSYGFHHYVTEQVPDTSSPKYIVIDGVQAEFNVIPNHCRQSFSNNLAVCFRKTAEQIHGKGIKASFAQTVEVDKKEMKSLSKEAQRFGCAPSKNAYGRTKVAVKDASKYYSRSAGGHIHIGDNGSSVVKAALNNPDVTVPILDIIVGNTCVLLDRDPGNVERRKNYGRAGEYRLPKHGLEYRTLSNFWLRSYQTMSFVLSLVRFAVNVAINPEATKHLLSLVDMEDIQRAINENDAVLAQQNFDKVKSFLSMLDGGDYPLQGARLERFEYFVSMGLDYWFKEDVMEHWVSHNYHHSNGWEQFIDGVVKIPAKSIKEVVKNNVEKVLAASGF